MTSSQPYFGQSTQRSNVLPAQDNGRHYQTDLGTHLLDAHRHQQTYFIEQQYSQPANLSGHRSPQRASLGDRYQPQQTYASSHHTTRETNILEQDAPPSYGDAISGAYPHPPRPTREKESPELQPYSAGNLSRGPSPQPYQPHISPLHHRLTTRASSSRMSKPIAIPATLAQTGSPFLRAYPLCLENYSISKTTFLSFLDNVNRVAVKSPPLQALSLAGSVVGFVPSTAAQITGAVVNISADVAAGVIQHGRIEAELKRANAEIFGPRGLKVEIAKTETLVRIAGIPGVLDVDGKLSKKTSLLLPMEDGGYDGGLNVNGQQRRLQAMSSYIADLEVDLLPEIEERPTAMSRLSVKASERQRVRGEQKLIKDRGKAQKDYEKESQKVQEDFNKEMKKADRELEKSLREIDRKLDETHRKRKDKDRDNLERNRQEVWARYEKAKAKAEDRYKKDMDEIEDGSLGNDREEKEMRKLNWLIIREQGAPNAPEPFPAVQGL